MVVYLHPSMEKSGEIAKQYVKITHEDVVEYDASNDIILLHFQDKKQIELYDSHLELVKTVDGTNVHEQANNKILMRYSPGSNFTRLARASSDSIIYIFQEQFPSRILEYKVKLGPIINFHFLTPEILFIAFKRDVVVLRILWPKEDIKPAVAQEARCRMHRGVTIQSYQVLNPQTIVLTCLNSNNYLLCFYMLRIHDDKSKTSIGINLHTIITDHNSKEIVAFEHKGQQLLFILTESNIILISEPCNRIIKEYELDHIIERIFICEKLLYCMYNNSENYLCFNLVDEDNCISINISDNQFESREQFTNEESSFFQDDADPPEAIVGAGGKWVVKVTYPLLTELNSQTMQQRVGLFRANPSDLYKQFGNNIFKITSFSIIRSNQFNHDYGVQLGLFFDAFQLGSYSVREIMNLFRCLLDNCIEIKITRMLHLQRMVSIGGGDAYQESQVRTWVLGDDLVVSSCNEEFKISIRGFYIQTDELVSLIINNVHLQRPEKKYLTICLLSALYQYEHIMLSSAAVTDLMRMCIFDAEEVVMLCATGVLCLDIHNIMQFLRKELSHENPEHLSSLINLALSIYQKSDINITTEEIIERCEQNTA